MFYGVAISGVDESLTLVAILAKSVLFLLALKLCNWALGWFESYHWWSWNYLNFWVVNLLCTHWGGEGVKTPHAFPISLMFKSCVQGEGGGDLAKKCVHNFRRPLFWLALGNFRHCRLKNILWRAVEYQCMWRHAMLIGQGHSWEDREPSEEVRCYYILWVSCLTSQQNSKIII